MRNKTLAYALGPTGEHGARQHHHAGGDAEEGHKTDSESDLLHNSLKGLKDQRQVDGRDIREVLDHSPLHGC